MRYTIFADDYGSLGPMPLVADDEVRAAELATRLRIGGATTIEILGENGRVYGVSELRSVSATMNSSR
jgi:hypothetical protein